MDRRFLYYLHSFKATKKDGKEKRKIPIKEILEIIVSSLTIAASISFAISLLIIYVWHKVWFENLGLPLDLSWIKSEFVVISLINIGYILFFLFIALIFIFSFYLSLRGVKKNLISLKNKKFDLYRFVTIIIIFIPILLLLYFLSSYFDFFDYFVIALILLSLSIIPSISFNTYLDQIFKRIRKYTDGNTYSREDIVAFPFTLIAGFLFLYYSGYNIFLSPLLYLFLLAITCISVLTSSIYYYDKKFPKLWIVFISIIVIFFVPMLLLISIAEEDANTVKRKIRGDNSYTSNKLTLPLDRLISSKSLQKGTVFIENIESVYDSINISNEKREQKILKDKWFISFGEMTLVFIKNDNTMLNIIVLKNGKFLRSVQVSGD